MIRKVIMILIFVALLSVQWMVFSNCAEEFGIDRELLTEYTWRKLELARIAEQDGVTTGSLWMSEGVRAELARLAK